MLLTLEEEKYYDNYFATFATEGWKQFLTEIQEILDSHRIEHIKDEKNLAFVQGERDALHRVVRFATGIRTNYTLIKEREAESND